MRERGSARAAIALAVMAAASAAQAAGGHFSVDDASLVEPGRWEQETWYSRSRLGADLLHTGFNFRVGAIELDGAAEGARSTNEPTATSWNLEMKWAHALSERVAVGLDVQPVALVRPLSQYAITRFYGIVTWQPHEAVLLNVNAGHDWVRRAGDLPRGGVSVEWTAAKAVTLIAERYLDTGTHFVRAGTRWSPASRWTFDFSRAQRLAGPAPSTWTLGLTYHPE